MTVPGFLRADRPARPDPVRPAEPAPVRLAHNELPFPPLPSVAAVLEQALANGHRYPDPAATRLAHRLGELVGAPETDVVVGPGSAALLQHLVQATCTPADAVLFCWPSFEAYPFVAEVLGVGRQVVPLDADGSHDLDGMLAAVTPATRLLILCNPNNPTGTVVAQERIAALVDAVPDHVLVVLDEAYREFAPAVDGVAVLHGARRANVAVLRTFSKAYGLAGLRVGYCVAPAPVAVALRRVTLPFTVTAAAQLAALASLDAGDELAGRVRAVVAERERVRAALGSMGWSCPPSHGNFLWLPSGPDAVAFAAHCAAAGIHVRAVPGEGVRVTVGGVGDNEALLRAAASFPGGWRWSGGEPGGSAGGAG
ncbi:histidinol-phosphate transaminase [Micromonospora carbonacea]|uniref:histidinol-phosphate transaminase n=1 Tax=Micromonospora carbonacea TaxID=47853 RepID=UPI003D72CE8B